MRLKPTTLLNGGAIQAVAFHPWVFIRPSRVADVALIEHERVHLDEQEAAGTVWWWAKYLLSRQFRQDAEVRAYRRQMELGGITVERAAHMLVTHYRLNIDLPTAIGLLQAKP
jgi:hypothetical protein